MEAVGEVKGRAQSTKEEVVVVVVIKQVLGRPLWSMEEAVKEERTIRGKEEEEGGWHFDENGVKKKKIKR